MNGKCILHPVMQICPAFVHVLHPTGSFLSVFSGAFQGKPMVVVLVDNLREAGFESKRYTSHKLHFQGNSIRYIPTRIRSVVYYYSCITSICVLLLPEAWCMMYDTVSRQFMHLL